MEVKEGKMTGREWIDERKNLESYCKEVDLVFGPLLIIHLLVDAVLITVFLFLNVKAVQAWGLFSNESGIHSCFILSFSLSMIIFHISAGWVHEENGIKLLDEISWSDWG
ncbi:unnamed protein product [Darwinula stevensoni]|uniref:Uncharacterized protein n=1 Tax=Darwinula stevensoni TaxID=69355 RepID=A0A7R9A6Z9_9CRUS|nr:unnamed protein product [Darwinula stevensoni]CAG0890877.1 unnamed protein product [Darwinula stevensoni]